MIFIYVEKCGPQAITKWQNTPGIRLRVVVLCLSPHMLPFYGSGLNPKYYLLKAIVWEFHASGIRPPDGCDLAINRKEDNDVTICRHDVIVKFFCCCFVSLVRFSYWSKFQVSYQYMISSGVKTIFVHKRLTRNPEIENTPVSVFFPISRE